jgi:hypothetical protein
MNESLWLEPTWHANPSPAGGIEENELQISSLHACHLTWSWKYLQISQSIRRMWKVGFCRATFWNPLSSPVSLGNQRPSVNFRDSTSISCRSAVSCKANAYKQRNNNNTVLSNRYSYTFLLHQWMNGWSKTHKSFTPEGPKWEMQLPQFNHQTSDKLKNSSLFCSDLKNIAKGSCILALQITILLYWLFKSVIFHFVENLSSWSDVPRPSSHFIYLFNCSTSRQQWTCHWFSAEKNSSM